MSPCIDYWLDKLLRLFCDACLFESFEVNLEIVEEFWYNCRCRWLIRRIVVSKQEFILLL